MLYSGASDVRMLDSIQLPRNKVIVAFRTPLLNWFKANGRKFPWRKEGVTSYQKIIAEILLQRTQANTISIYFPVFIKRFPSWKSITLVSEDELGDFLKPVGLWKRRASSLALISVEMAKRNGRFPRNRDMLESLPGIGQYMANAVLLLCHGEPQPLLDTNMARVLERYFGPRQLADIRHDPYLQGLSRSVINCPQSRDLNFAILDFAALVCKIEKPKCIECPLSRCCKYFSAL